MHNRMLEKEKTEAKTDAKRAKKGSAFTAQFTVVKRTGAIVPFHRNRIFCALEAAFRKTKEIAPKEPLSKEFMGIVEEMTNLVVAQVISRATQGASLSVEGIQDVVEMTLMQNGRHDVARDYIIYRDKHKTLRDDSPQNLKIRRQDGAVVRFNPMKIGSSIESTFFRTHQKRDHFPTHIVAAINRLTEKVVACAWELSKSGTALTSTLIEDQIEDVLMREGFFKEAKNYILHRSEEKEPPSFFVEEKEKEDVKVFTITTQEGKKSTISETQLLNKFKFASRDLESVDPKELLTRSLSNFYEGIKEKEVDASNLMAARSKIEEEPAYSKVAARLLLDMVYRETMEVGSANPNLKELHEAYFKKAIPFGVESERYSPKLFDFDLDRLAKGIDLKRDDTFTYLGLQTLYDRYFIHHNDRRFETPQLFWMRVAMGLSIEEKGDKTARAIEFYDLLSQFYFVSATPTLFNSGTPHSQLSSCYLSTVSDDLKNIFKVISDNAMLSKWAGGIGNDWTAVRATGSRIKGTNGRSQGIIPFLKVANDTALAVNQGGKRKGATCAYLETWHLDIEEFLEMRKNTGDERRRTHDMHTANWIPDLFMKRVQEEGKWTLFSPGDTPDLHDLYGEAFEKRYCEYEAMAQREEIPHFKEVEAVHLWRKMLSMLFETGHPWITFKDPSNIRSPQDHAGVVHNSNLCTEILLNTSHQETAVCNLGSINLARHTTSQGLDEKRLQQTIRTAVRMLDNVIDINFYPTDEAKAANVRHRPIGMGIMGFQDALYIQNLSYASHEAIQFADTSMEMISYYALLASSELAKDRGTYASYKGSKWDRGLLPIDTLELLVKERGSDITVDRSTHMDWQPVREAIKKHGMRNSNTLAIAPTATIANIAGAYPSVEPAYKHLFVKSNLSGDFTHCNPYLVGELKRLGLWDKETVDDLKYFDGSISEIDRIPEDVKRRFLTAFEIEPEWIIECASRRQKWIDMGQSLNLYLARPSGKKLHTMYFDAWKKGLKTTYYCRTLAATQVEKSTTDINKRGLQPRWMKSKSASSNIQVQRQPAAAPSCKRGAECESCQ